MERNSGVKRERETHSTRRAIKKKKKRREKKNSFSLRMKGKQMTDGGTSLEMLIASAKPVHRC